MSESQAGRPLSIYVNGPTAKRAEDVAAAENRKVGQLGGEALAFWTALPPSARAALRYVQGLGTEADVRGAYRDVARVLLIAQRNVASERASAEIEGRFEGLEEMSETELEELAVELSDAPAEPTSHERVQSLVNRTARRAGPRRRSASK